MFPRPVPNKAFCLSSALSKRELISLNSKALGDLHNLKMGQGSQQCNGSLFSAAACTAQVRGEGTALPKTSEELMKQSWELSSG